MDREYVSPFLLPSDREKKCSEPSDALHYPHIHQRAGEPGYSRAGWGPECPVHGKTARESKGKNYEWDLWYKYREAYARGEDPAWNLSQMLHAVTLENPPDRPADIEVKLNLAIPLLLTAIFAGSVMFVITLACLLT